MSVDPYGLALEYLSARQCGTWKVLAEALKMASSAVADPSRWQPGVGLIALNFFTLSHLEVDFDAALQWRVSPTSLVISGETGSVRAALCGARTRSLLSTVSEAAQGIGVEVHTASQWAAPSRVELVADEEDKLRVAARTAGIPIVEGPAYRVLRMAPSLSDLIDSAEVRPLPSGYDTAKFDSVKLTWIPVNRVDGDGAYQFASYRNEYRLVRDGLALKVEKAVAAYGELAQSGSSVITFDENALTLRLPARVRPPRLYERAAVLCTCALPSYDPRSGRLNYLVDSRRFADLFKAKLELPQQVLA